MKNMFFLMTVVWSCEAQCWSFHIISYSPYQCRKLQIFSRRVWFRKPLHRQSSTLRVDLPATCLDVGARCSCGAQPSLVPKLIPILSHFCIYFLDLSSFDYFPSYITVLLPSHTSWRWVGGRIYVTMLPEPQPQGMVSSRLVCSY